MAVRTVVVRYVGDVNSLAKSLDQVASANDRVASSTDKTGSGISNLGKAAAVSGLALGTAVAKFAEFDAQMSAVAAASGATGAELNNLREAAIKAGADTQYSATEAAAAITELSKAGVSAGDILGGGLNGALTLAAAGQMDVAEAAETAATAMNQFGLSGDQVTHVADLLAAGANSAQGSVSDMGMALKQAGLVANQTGLSIEETTAGLTAFASAGLIGSDAGTSFKSMLQRLTPTSVEAKNLMEELGISAYDAGGNFIGLEAFAGNLRSALQNLTPEQRNAAMATIFGSDAVRAASVLYENGAEGIAKWTDAVNQQGYAADQAAKLTDNLKGDLERLGGAFDTVMIQSGSGVNNFARSAVQGLENLVELVGKIPGPVLVGAAAFTSLAFAGKKVGPALAPIKTAGTGAWQSIRLAGMYASQATGPVNKLSTGFSMLGKSMGGLKGAASGVLGMLGGGWGLVLMAATAGVTGFMQAQANAAAAAQELTDTLNAQTGAFTQTSKDTVVGWLAKDLEGITDDQVDRLNKLGINLSGAADAAMAGGPAMEAYARKLADAGMQDKSLMEVTNGLASSMGNANESVQQSTAAWKLQADAKAESAAVDATITAGQGALSAAMGSVAGAADTAADSTSGLTAEQKASAEAAEAQKEAIDILKSSILDYGNVTSGAIGSEMAWQAALDDNAAALEKNGATLDLTTEKGRANMQTLLDMGEAAKANAVKMAEAGAGSDVLTTSLNKQREALITAADKMGYNRAQATALADELIPTNELVAELTDTLGDVPNKTLAYVTSPDAIATKGAVDAVQAALKKIPQVTLANIDTPGATAGQQKVNDLRSEISQLRGKNAPIDTPGATAGQKKVNDLRSEIAQLRGKQVTVSVVSSGIGAVQAALNSIQNVTRTVTVKTVRTGQAINAEGGYYPKGSPAVAFAGGGTWSPDTPDGHLPHIAPGGTNRVFAERETQGEAYIPLANDWRRPQAKAILGQVAGQMGGAVQWFASGGIRGASPADAAMIRALLAAIIQPLQAVADANQALVAQQRATSQAQNSVTAATRLQTGSSNALAVENRQYALLVKNRDALKAKAAAAKKAADATRGVTAADRTYAAIQAQLANAEKAVAASKAKKATLETAYKDAVDKVKAATDALTDSQKDLADAQKDLLSAQQAVSDEAGRQAESFRDAYGPNSIDPAKWVQSMTQGAGDLNRFLSQIERLRSSGLQESLVQQIIDAGVLNGGRLAENILASGSSGALNTSWEKLLGASNNLGLGTVAPGLGQIDYALLAKSVAGSLPLSALLGVMQSLPVNVKDGVTKGMVDAQAESRRYARKDA